jgi:hypothetical protein
MSMQVKVDDLEVFKHFRIALLKFAQAVDQSLASAESDIARMHSWLENEQSRFWEGQVRKRMEAVTRAKDAVRQKKLFLDGAGKTRNASEEEKALAKCVAQLEEAQSKGLATRKALPRLEKAADMYKGGVSRLSTDIAAEVPRAIGRLDRMAASLEEYIAIESPAMNVPPAENSVTEAEMSRGGEAGDVPAQDAVAPREAASPETPQNRPEEKEGNNVVN